MSKSPIQNMTGEQVRDLRGSQTGAVFGESVREELATLLGVSKPETAKGLGCKGTVHILSDGKKYAVYFPTKAQRTSAVKRRADENVADQGAGNSRE